MRGDVLQALALLEEIEAAGPDGINRRPLMELMPIRTMYRLLRALEDADAIERVCPGRWKALPLPSELDIRPKLGALLRERPQKPEKALRLSRHPSDLSAVSGRPGASDVRCGTCRWHRRRLCQLKIGSHGPRLRRPSDGKDCNLYDPKDGERFPPQLPLQTSMLARAQDRAPIEL